MGLQEKRKIKELQDITIPERLIEIEEICGAKIPYQIDWESFENDLEALNFLDNLSCHRLNMALRTICADEFGKAAIRDSLKLIKLKNVEKQNMLMKFHDGILEMHCAYALRTEGMFSDNEIYHLLMKYL